MFSSIHDFLKKHKWIILAFVVNKEYKMYWIKRKILKSVINEEKYIVIFYVYKIYQL